MILFSDTAVLQKVMEDGIEGYILMQKKTKIHLWFFIIHIFMNSLKASHLHIFKNVFAPK